LIGIEADHCLVAQEHCPAGIHPAGQCYCSGEEITQAFGLIKKYRLKPTISQIAIVSSFYMCLPWQ
jgi:hypothetical protein